MDGDAEDEFVINIYGEKDDETVMEIVVNALENEEGYLQEVHFSVELTKNQSSYNLDKALNTSNFNTSYSNTVPVL